MKTHPRKMPGKVLAVSAMSLFMAALSSHASESDRQKTLTLPTPPAAPASSSSPLPPPTRPSATRETQEALPVPESPLEEETRLTKNWGGARKVLSDLGIDIALFYKGEVNRVFSGGLNRETTYLGNVDLRLSIDAEKLVGWKGSSFFFYGLSDHGGHPSQNVGDAQVTSNIETATASMRLYEAWWQQIGYDDKFSLLLGLHDLNSEFYVTETSGLFFNSSFGVGKELSQTGINGPSIFPVTSLAARLRAEPTKTSYMQLAVFEGQAGNPDEPKGTHISLNSKDGQLLIGEAGIRPGKDRPDSQGGKYAIGVWTYTHTFDSRLDTVQDANGNTVPAQTTSYGAYALSEQAVSSMVSLFLRYGVAATTAEKNRFESCLGTGVVLTGLIPGRSKDRFGIAMARAANGDQYKTQQQLAGTPVSDAETTFEANYRIEAIRGVAIQPDLQYVIHPNTDPEIKNALVGAARIEISF